MILGYLDKNEKNISVTEQRQQIVQYASENNLMIDMFIAETSVCDVVSQLSTANHTVVIANIVALGTSLSAIKESISLLGKLNLELISVKEGYVWKPEDLRAILPGLDLVIDIRSSLSSIMTTKALADKKASGVVLGRQTPNRTRVFDNKEEYIKQQLAKGVTKVQIAKDLGVSQGYLYAFLRAHPEVRPEFKGTTNFNVSTSCRGGFVKKISPEE